MDSEALFLIELWFYSSSVHFFIVVVKYCILARILADYFIPTIVCCMKMKNILTRIVNFETTILDNKNNLKSVT